MNKGILGPNRSFDLDNLTEMDELYIVGSADAGSHIWRRENYWTDDQYMTVMAILAQSSYSSEKQRQIATRIIREARSEKAQEIRRSLIRERRNQFARLHAARYLALIDRDGYLCAKCGSQNDLTIDHIVPLSKGGTDVLENLQFLCRSCNSSKGDSSNGAAALDNLGL